VSTLWTPSGEHDPSGGGDGGGEHGGSGPDHPDDTPLSPEEQAEYDELVRTRAELAAIPVPDIVANHAVGLWQLAVLHLTPDPAPDGTPTEPRLAEAGLAIDALAALVDTLGPRLAPHDETLREALTQLQLAFVQVSEG
jgi:hypothetical protein